MEKEHKNTFTNLFSFSSLMLAIFFQKVDSQITRFKNSNDLVD